MPFDRASGLLLHVTSLPSYGGIGDFGPAAYAFADFLADIEAASVAGAAAQPHRIRQLALRRALCLRRESAAHLSRIPRPVGMDRPRPYRRPSRALRRSALGRRSSPQDSAASKRPRATSCISNSAEEWARFEGYCRMNGTWLESYAFYSVLRRKFNGASWHTWPAETRASRGRRARQNPRGARRGAGRPAGHPVRLRRAME